MADLDEIKRLMVLSQNELFELLGSEDGAAFATPENKRQRGRTFFQNSIEKYRDKICADSRVRKYIASDDGAMKLQAAAAIADLMGGHGAATVAVLAIQSSVRDLCAKHWRNAL